MSSSCLQRFDATILAALATFLVAPAARADFSAYCDLTVAGYDANRSALANFPVLVRISETGISGFSYSQLQSDGKDLAFTSTDGATTYPHEIDTWKTSGESLVWVLLPSMQNGTTFRMNWGDPSITAAPAYTTSGQMWIDAGYVGVWHLGEAADAPYSLDSTANRLNATNNAVAASSVAGVVGAGRNPASDGKTGKYGMVVEGWVTWQADNFTDKFTATTWTRHSNGNLNYDHLFSTKGSYSDGNGGWAVLTAHASGSGWYTYGSSNGKNQLTTNILTGASAEWQHVAVTFNGTARKLYLDGTVVKSNSSGLSKATATTNPLGLGAPALETSSGNHWRGDLDEMRVSSVARSDDWVYAEYITAKDTAFLTYGNAVSEVASLAISGDPDNYGTADPAYGATTAVTPGGSFTASVTATNLVASGTERWICTGYSHYEITDAATGARTLTEEGSSSSFTYIHVGQDALVWHFTNEWLVAVSATEGGSVSATEAWTLNGDAATLIATPDSGYEFFGWVGDTDGIADTTAATIVPTVTATRSLRAVFAPAGIDITELYVADTGDDANDGYSSESPKLTIQAAVDTLAMGPGHGTVHVAPGHYQTSSSESVAVSSKAVANIVVTNAIAIVGATDKPEDVVVSNTSTYNTAQVVVLYLDHPGAFVANLTVENGHRNAPEAPFGGNVSIDAAGGTVSNCVLRGANSIGNYARGTGAWLNSDAALLTHCVVTNNAAACSGYQYSEGIGAFVHVARGTVANCLIANNRDGSGTGVTSNPKQAWANGVAVDNGALLNCSVVTNEARFTAGVYLHPNGVATNVVVAGCVNRSTYPSAENPDWSDIGFKGTLSNASHCASDGGEALDETCKAGTAADFFEDFENGNYTLSKTSPLVNAGIAYDGIAAFDLAGQKRVQGSAPDIGAYESRPSGLSLIFR